MKLVRFVALAAAFASGLVPAVARAADQVAATPPAVTAATAPVPAAADIPALTAQQQAELFRDVPANSWSYNAIKDLAQKGLIQGYPDGTFKGQRPLTRYEAAVLVERAVNYVLRQIPAPAPPPPAAPKPEVTAADIAAIRALLDEYKGDIDALKIRVGQIDDRLKAVETQTKAMNIHALYFVRGGNFQDEVAAYNGNGTALPVTVPGSVLTTNSGLGSGVNTGRNALYPGLFNAGTGYQVLRLFFDGDLDSRVSYHARLENRYYFDNAGNNGSSNGTRGNASTVPSYCTGNPGATITTCGADYPTNSTVRFNYANLQYKDPSGFDVTIGRFVEGDSGLGLNYTDYFNGVRLGFTKGPFNIRAGYSFNFPALSNGGAGAGLSYQTMFAALQYVVNKQITLGGSYILDVNAPLTLWNPSSLATNAQYAAYNANVVANKFPFFVTPFAGAYQNVTTPIGTGSLWINWNPFRIVNIQAEGLLRAGNDPFTKTSWAQNAAFQTQVQVGNFRPSPFKGYIEGGYIASGFNSNNGHTNLIGTTGYQQFYIANPNGYEIEYAGVHYWIGRGTRIGVVYQHYDVLSGTTIPAGSQPTSTTTFACPGCFITHDIGNAVFLQGLLNF